MKRIFWLGMGAALLAGCGGSGGSSSVDSREVEQDYGNLTTRSVGAVAPPMVMSTGNLSVTGIFGASFSLARLNLPPATQLNSEEVAAATQIGFDNSYSPRVLNVRDWTSYSVAPNSPATYYPTHIALSPLGDRVYTTEYDFAAGWWQVFVTTVDGQTRTRLTSDASNKFGIDVSPDGSKLVVGHLIGGIYQVGVLSANGGAITDVTTGSPSKNYPKWSPDGTMIAYVTSDSQLWKMNANGSSPARLLSGYNVMSCDWTTGGDLVALTYSSPNYSIIRVPSQGLQQTVYSTTDYIGQVSVSPDGQQVAFTSSAGGSYDIHTVPIIGGTPVRRTFLGNVSTVNWGPYIRQKSFIGSGGALSSGAGFLVAQKGKSVPSYVVFDATTRSGVTVEPSETHPNQANLICIVKASDALTQIRYSNHLFSPVTAVLTSGATASGAVVSFDTATGDVASVIPYTGTVAPPKARGNQVTVTGKLLGVWDANGKNLAEGGATTVAIDRATGKPTLTSP